MKQTYVEVVCDQCLCVIGHYPPGYVDQTIRDDGGIVTRGGKHFCDKECRAKDRASMNPLSAQEANIDNRGRCE